MMSRLCRLTARQTVDATNFRFDVNATAGRLTREPKDDEKVILILIDLCPCRRKKELPFCAEFRQLSPLTAQE